MGARGHLAVLPADDAACGRRTLAGSVARSVHAVDGCAMAGAGTGGSILRGWRMGHIGRCVPCDGYGLAGLVLARILSRGSGGDPRVRRGGRVRDTSAAWSPDADGGFRPWTVNRLPPDFGVPGFADRVGIGSGAGPLGGNRTSGCRRGAWCASTIGDKPVGVPALWDFLELGENAVADVCGSGISRGRCGSDPGGHGGGLRTCGVPCETCQGLVGDRLAATGPDRESGRRRRGGVRCSVSAWRAFFDGLDGSVEWNELECRRTGCGWRGLRVRLAPSDA